ncbi:PBP1A family penicillin-binding protein [Salipiger mucosus]|uniref:Multimodular transpeptidase-transglycosylase n=1 Tax=Salipiger mucosus DSM 16094 TaxID=1123237 RepID=S9RNG9_9RHOB|nr:PBP1A family penicillin-binding protein [Salipiger mucosus]EPX75524.1 Multimodular transpeptidase-transglycosylase [Salipiger mucosus DSM 16094]
MTKPDQSPARRLAGSLATRARGAGRALAGLGLRRGLALGTAALLLVLVAGGTLWLATRPSLDELEAARAPDIEYRDANGEALYLAHGVTDEHVPLAEIPEHLQEAVIALEDRRFRAHDGIDLRGIARAATRNLMSEGIVEGGSTITQQLVKITYLRPEKSYLRKLHEAMLAREMEDRYSKDEILEAYLNRVYLGSGASGVGGGARIYFGKPVQEVSLAEAAALAAILRAPSEVNPFRDTEALRARAGLVIRLMAEQGRIDAGQANAARVELATMAPRPKDAPYGGWFADWVQGQARKLAASLDGDVTLRTTLDPELQRRAERAVAGALGGQPMQAALVALRRDGTVAAMVGGNDYAQTEFNRATDAVRQPGSTFKTFVYLTALERGMRPGELIPDMPINIDGYRPQNFDGKYRGQVSLAAGLAHSINAATVNLAHRLGIHNVAETARALGIEAELTETPSLALGASGMTLLDLTEAYAAIATGRAPIEARGIAGVQTRDHDYEPLAASLPAPRGRAEQLLAHRDTMTSMLRAVVTDGTGHAVRDKVPGAVGKTGTSQNHRDALFVGWANDLIVGVWVGNDDDSPMDGVTGGSLPARIWAEVLSGTAPSAETGDADTLATDMPTPRIRPQDLDTSAPEPDRTETATAPEPRAQPQQRAQQQRRAQPGRAVEGLVNRALNGGRVSARDVMNALTSDLSGGRRGCNVRACQQAYRSFRASDCTYQPYGNRPRQRCTR